MRRGNFICRNDGSERYKEYYDTKILELIITYRDKKKHIYNLSYFIDYF
jgi:hypothetical protein